MSYKHSSALHARCNLIIFILITARYLFLALGLIVKFAYEDLSPNQFEELVVLICHKLLGVATQGFATGRDGGRDARFIGTANLYPSENSPWKGTVIIQAKHTEGYNKSFSESDFYSSENSSCIITQEIPKIIKLREIGELDHYMLFANRKLTAQKAVDLQNHLAKECDLPLESICLCGLTQLETWLKVFPQISSQANFDPIDAPLIVDPDELSEVVEVLGKKFSLYENEKSSYPTDRVSYDKKNVINNMSEEYANELKKRYLKHTFVIEDFLSDPENDVLKLAYENAVEEFQANIIAKRKEYQDFDSVMNYLRRFLCSRDPILKRNKKLTNAILFYMYWNCDIGQSENAETN